MSLFSRSALVSSDKAPSDALFDWAFAKFLAAKRAGVRDVILPIDVKPNVEEDLTDDQTEGVTIHYASHIEDVLAVALPHTMREAQQAEQMRDELLTAA